MDTNTGRKRARKEVHSSSEQDWWSYDPQGQSGECVQAQQVLLSNAESLTYGQQSEFNSEDAVDLRDVINIPPASDNWEDISDVGSNVGDGSDVGDDDDSGDDVEYNEAGNPFAGLDSEDNEIDGNDKIDDGVKGEIEVEVKHQPAWNKPKKTKKFNARRKWNPMDFSFLLCIQFLVHVNFGKLTKFFKGHGSGFVDDFTRVGVLTVLENAQFKFNLKSGMVSIGGLLNCLVVDQKSGSRNLSNYLEKVTTFLDNGLYCPRQYWEQVKYALGLIKVLDVVLRIVKVDKPVLRAYMNACDEWSRHLRCDIEVIEMVLSKDGLWEAIDFRTGEILELRFEETLEAHLPAEFSAKLAQLVEQEKKRRIKRQWEERRAEQRRRAAMPGAATIIQRAWLRLVDRRAEEAALAESNERIRTSLIVIGSYFVGVASVLATSFF